METISSSFLETLIKIEFQGKLPSNNGYGLKIIKIDKTSFIIATQTPENLLLLLNKDFKIERKKEESISWKEVWTLKRRRKP